MKHINFADLRVFLAIADTGNLTRAAAQCCITPSAASVRLKHLEEEAGCDLVKRLPRGLALTSAGERLAAEARKVFQQITRMTDAMTAFRGDERLVVRLAANYNAAVAFLPDDLSGFLLQNPDIRRSASVHEPRRRGSHRPRRSGHRHHGFQRFPRRPVFLSLPRGFARPLCGARPSARKTAKLPL